jgi:type 2A phosphatase activator TIP41
MPQTSATKQYDWTYTTVYSGHREVVSSDEDGKDQTTTAPEEHLLWRPANSDDPSQTIPMAELSRQDPILFYAEIPVFEDELHDNGASHLLVRIVSCYCR